MIAATFEQQIRAALAREFPGLALTHWSIEAKSRVGLEHYRPGGMPFRFEQPYGKYEVALTLEEAPPSVVASIVAEALKQ